MARLPRAPSAADLRPAAGMPGTRLLQRRLAVDERPVVILDDDPTGTQTSSDVDVVLDPRSDRLADLLSAGNDAVFVLTNTRAVDAVTAAELVREVVGRARGAATQPAVVLRGDSTLRGHVVAELRAVSTPSARWLICPAFPEGGRVTLDGHHWVRLADQWLPADQTEFAADPVFGYGTSHLLSWMKELDDGRPAHGVAISDLRRSGGDAVADALVAMPPGGVVLPDAVTRDDVALVVCGLLEAESRGLDVSVRGAATLAGLRAGLAPRQCTVPPADGPVLVVIGSHTDLAARQLADLVSTHAITPVVVPTDEAMTGRGDDVATDLAPRLRKSFSRRGLAVLASERARSADHASLDHGAAVMNALTATVRAVADDVSAVVAKGGITAADVATAGLGAQTATVQGQVAAGVPLWSLDRPEGRIPYLLVPGNVGVTTTLSSIVTGLVPR